MTAYEALKRGNLIPTRCTLKVNRPSKHDGLSSYSACDRLWVASSPGPLGDQFVASSPRPFGRRGSVPRLKGQQRCRWGCHEVFTGEPP